MKKLIVLFLIPVICFGRPSPQKQTQEIFNDVYRDSLNTPEASLEVTLTATEFGIIQLPGDMNEGATISFSSTNVLDSAYTDIMTATVAAKQLQIINNSGGSFYLRGGATVKGVIAPGQESIQPFAISIGDAVSIQSVSGTVSTGNIFVNLFGE